MAGKNRNFYGGDLSELLAGYLLAKIGIANPVLRQFDIGTDFYCNLMDADAEYLTFGNPFAIQIKSASDPTVEFGHTKPKKWKIRNIQNLFENQIPFFVGIINKKKTSIKIFDTSALWQLYTKGPLNFSRIIMAPNSHPPGEYRYNFQAEKLAGWESTAADGYLYRVDLGNPIIEFNDRDTKKSLMAKSDVLKRIIILEQINITNRNLGVNCFKEVKINDVNDPQPAVWGMNIKDDLGKGYVDKIYESIRLPLISLSSNLFALDKSEECNEVNAVLKNIPVASYYSQLFSHKSGHWDWMEPLLQNQMENARKNIIIHTKMPDDLLKD